MGELSLGAEGLLLLLLPRPSDSRSIRSDTAAAAGGEAAESGAAAAGAARTVEASKEKWEMARV